MLINPDMKTMIVSLAVLLLASSALALDEESLTIERNATKGWDIVSSIKGDLVTMTLMSALLPTAEKSTVAMSETVVDYLKSLDPYKAHTCLIKRDLFNYEH